MLKDLTSIIMKHTASSRRHLTPELVLRLISPECQLWSAREHECPFKDPFWAFYWPGGQATARYILDNGHVVKNQNILDIGCGCGASSIAAAKMNAKHVLANDIDPYAIVATQINAALNEVKVNTSTINLIGSKCDDFNVIIIGDMFYDEEFSQMLFEWLMKLSKEGKMVLIGDPGRHGLTETRRKHIKLLAEYKLLKENQHDNNGFTKTQLWTLNK